MKKVFKNILILAIISSALIFAGCENNKVNQNLVDNSNNNASATVSENNEINSPENELINESTITENSNEFVDNSSNIESNIDENSELNTSSELVSYIPIKDIDDEPGEIGETHSSEPISTDNKKFNEFFADNSIDIKFQQELKYCDTTKDMMSKTAEYANAWYNEVFDAFDMLVDLLKGQDDKIQSLNADLEAWSNSVSEIINGYDQEARNNGGSVINILDAENKKMLFYRSQACEYYKQVYELIGDFDLSIG